MLLNGTSHETDDTVRFSSTHISESQQAEIDSMLTDARRKVESYRELYEKV